MLSIQEINELEQDLIKAQSKNLELEAVINMQTRQYNSLLTKYNELMQITKNFWKQINKNKDIKESLALINSL